MTCKNWNELPTIMQWKVSFSSCLKFIINPKQTSFWFFEWIVLYYTCTNNYDLLNFLFLWKSDDNRSRNNPECCSQNVNKSSLPIYQPCVTWCVSRFYSPIRERFLPLMRIKACPVNLSLSETHKLWIMMISLLCNIVQINKKVASTVCSECVGNSWMKAREKAH